MIEFAQNKSMAGEENISPESVTVKAVSATRNEYHFTGSGKWQPVSVIAASFEDAIEAWKEVRKSIETVEEAKTNQT